MSVISFVSLLILVDHMPIFCINCDGQVLLQITIIIYVGGSGGVGIGWSVVPVTLSVCLYAL